MSKIDLKLDWSKINSDISKELFRPIPDTGDRVVRFAHEFERKLFTYLLFAELSKVYVWDETDVRDGMWSTTWQFGEYCPDGHRCTLHDFQNLIDMSDDEFNSLPLSPNTGLVKSWRELMRGRMHDTK